MMFTQIRNSKKNILGRIKNIAAAALVAALAVTGRGGCANAASVYTPIADDMSIKAEVTVKSGPMPSSASFTIELKALDPAVDEELSSVRDARKAPLPVSEESTESLEDPSAVTITVRKSAVADFGSAVYDMPGDYYYSLREVKGKMRGVKYDDTVYTLLVRVINEPESEGGLAIAHTAWVGSADEALSDKPADIVFANSYKPETVDPSPVPGAEPPADPGADPGTGSAPSGEGQGVLGAMRELGRRVLGAVEELPEVLGERRRQTGDDSIIPEALAIIVISFGAILILLRRNRKKA
ncbi:Spy0128 family protein [Butyrivibrio sp. MC2013]|uniref:Spy0128 family protein n=1 Tax=Butyrivibrio sp. MC2013 TaxID=1280686 RepID=UPI00040FB861|nr:FctA domain-containing protein [Butyrivibrio sp. MC2013]